MWIWELASVLAGVLVVLVILLGIFLIFAFAVIGSGFAIANRKPDAKVTAKDHPARHLRSVD